MSQKNPYTVQINGRIVHKRFKPGTKKTKVFDGKPSEATLDILKIQALTVVRDVRARLAANTLQTTPATEGLEDLRRQLRGA